MTEEICQSVIDWNTHAHKQRATALGPLAFEWPLGREMTGSQNRPDRGNQDANASVHKGRVLTFLAHGARGSNQGPLIHRQPVPSSRMTCHFGASSPTAHPPRRCRHPAGVHAPRADPGQASCQLPSPTFSLTPGL